MSKLKDKWAAVLLILVTAGYSPMLYRHFLGLWRHHHYQFFPLVIAAVICLAYERGLRPRDIAKALLSMTRLQYLVVVMAAVLLLLSSLLQTPNAAMVSWMLFTGAIVANIQQRRGVSLWGVWLASGILVRLPGVLENKLIGGLQLFSSKVSSYLLDWSSVNHLLTGNIFHLGSKQLFVDEACSGIISLFSIMACALMFAAYRRYSLLRTAAIVVAGVLCTTMINVLRIFSIAYFEDKFDLNLADGLPHFLLGMVLFAASLSLLWVIDRVFGLVLLPIPKASVSSRPSTLINVWNRMTTAPDTDLNLEEARTPVAKASNPFQSRYALLSVLLLLSFGVWAGRQVLSTTIKSTRVSVMDTLGSLSPEKILPADQKADSQYELEERNTGHVNGEISHVFHFPESPSHYFSIDLPFNDGWHELTSCYLGSGWQLDSRIVRQDAFGDFVEAEFSKKTGERGFLVFSLVDSAGRAVTARPSSGVPTWSWFEIKRRVMQGMSDELVQYQVWHTSNGTVEEAVKERLRGDFLQLRAAATQELFPNAKAKSEMAAN